MSAPQGFEPLPFGDLYFAQFTHVRRTPHGVEYWNGKRPGEYLRVVYSDYSRIETVHQFDINERGEQ